MSSLSLVNKKSEKPTVTLVDNTKNKNQSTDNSPGMILLSKALVNVEEVLLKNEETLLAVREQLTKLSNQRIGLTSQKNMLIELKTQLEREENTVKELNKVEK